MIKAKKTLGQHFLHSEKIISDIVSAGKVRKGDVVIEIGPGEGILTSALLKTGASVVAIEKDDRLIPLLSKKFSKEISSNRFQLFHADILDPKMLKYLFNTPLNLLTRSVSKFKVVANIPYYITGQIIRMFLEADKQPESMTLLVQKEVAERVVAKDKKESLLSLSVKVYGKPRIVSVVKKGSFTPMPKVDSAILVIENISKKTFLAVKPLSGENRVDEKRFFEILHVGFAHKRKQLLPNLLNGLLTRSVSRNGNSISGLELELELERDDLIKIFYVCDIDLLARAEDLSLETWIKLCNKINAL